MARRFVKRRLNRKRPTVGQNQVILRHLVIHLPRSSGESERVSKEMNTAERVSEASIAEQAIE